MTPTVKRILDQCKALGIIVEASPDGQYLDLHYQAPPPEQLRQLLRTHKADILAILNPKPPMWHAQEIAKAVDKEGCCLFWSEVLREVVAFARDETFQGCVPTGVVIYTSAELRELHQGKPAIPPQTLRMIHAAKKAGGRVSSRRMEC